MTSFKQILPKIVKLLNQFKKEKLIQNYTLIGGVAVATRGFFRATHDLDFLINAEEEFFKEELFKRIEREGYIVEIYKGAVDDPLRGLIRILDTDRSPLADLILIHWKWQRDIIDSAEGVKLENISVPIAKAEDLIILKLKAGSFRDLLDAEELAKAVLQSGKLDRKRLLSLSKRAGVDRKLNKLLLQL